MNRHFSLDRKTTQLKQKTLFRFSSHFSSFFTVSLSFKLVFFAGIKKAVVPLKKINDILDIGMCRTCMVCLPLAAVISSRRKSEMMRPNANEAAIFTNWSSLWKWNIVLHREIYIPHGWQEDSDLSFREVSAREHSICLTHRQRSYGKKPKQAPWFVWSKSRSSVRIWFIPASSTRKHQ